jgi:hypothetical protein
MFLTPDCKPITRAGTLLNRGKYGRIYHLTVSMHHKGHCVGGEACTLCEVLPPLGFTVRTTLKYWSLIETKHPKLRGRAQEVVGVLGHPDQVCQSRQDTAVYLFYRIDQSRLLCAVVKRLDGEGFLITAYPCDEVKEGDRIWPT